MIDTALGAVKGDVGSNHLARRPVGGRFSGGPGDHQQGCLSFTPNPFPTGMALQPRQSAPSSSTIHLDHGADSAAFDPRDLRVSARGVSLPARWRFEPGAEVAINFQLDDGTPCSRPRTLHTVGVVVDCEADTRVNGIYWLTLLFLESTEDVLTLVQALADYRARLAAEAAKAVNSQQALDEIPDLKFEGPSFEV